MNNNIYNFVNYHKGDVTIIAFNKTNEVTSYDLRTMESAVQFGTPEAAEAEMRAQIQMTLQNKMNITHLDFHMISVLMPKFIDSYLKVGQEFRVPALIPKMEQKMLVQLGLGDLYGFLSKGLSGNWRQGCR